MILANEALYVGAPSRTKSRRVGMSSTHAEHYRWSEIPWETLNEKINRRFIYGDKIMLTQLQLKEGAVVPEHHHWNEQISYILTGSLKFWVGENSEEIIVKEGESIFLPSNVSHKVLSMKDTRALDIFSPPREDWINKTDDYLRNV